uniref:Uncharacterized protein n=1 Tax=Arundo donax TaxID=35708 RepID=A0A0A9HW88_ARUDO
MHSYLNSDTDCDCTERNTYEFYGLQYVRPPLAWSFFGVDKSYLSSGPRLLDFVD